jgi:hypothetical protein
MLHKNDHLRIPVTGNPDAKVIIEEWFLQNERRERLPAGILQGGQRRNGKKVTSRARLQPATEPGCKQSLANAGRSRAPKAIM